METGGVGGPPRLGAPPSGDNGAPPSGEVQSGGDAMLDRQGRMVSLAKLAVAAGYVGGRIRLSRTHSG
jgi:hypothetical protein